MRQFKLFDTSPPPRDRGIGPAAVDDSIRELGARLDPLIRLGTSSWSFPGWEGIVWDRKTTTAKLSREGLAAYARHPILRSVGIDRTYYASIDASTFAGYAGQVPDDFRFLVKAASDCTSPWKREGGFDTSVANPRFLDPRWTSENVVAPMMEGLGEKAGPLVFQFSPLGKDFTRDPARFADTLGEFLTRLPRGPWYTVELRDRDLLTDSYVAVLRQTGATHCINIHPRMPGVDEQAEIAGSLDEPRLAIRWMLHSGFAYEEAKDRYAPFSRIVDADPASRSSLAELAVERRKRGGETILIANNKAEGSAPLTLVELARLVIG